MISFCSQCDPMEKRYPIMIKNNAEYSIGFYMALVRQEGTSYPDTLLPINNKYIVYNILSNTKFYEDFSVELKYIFDELPKDTLSVFIFNQDTLNTNSWETIRHDYKILKRYDLSLQDLEMLNYEVPFPPSQKLANIKQFPKYE